MCNYSKKNYKMFSLAAVWVLWILLAATLAHSAHIEVFAPTYWVFPTDFFDSSNNDSEEEDEDEEIGYLT